MASRTDLNSMATVPTPAEGEVIGEGQRIRLKVGKVGDGDEAVLAVDCDDDDETAAAGAVADSEEELSDGEYVVAGDGGAVNLSEYESHPSVGARAHCSCKCWNKLATKRNMEWGAVRGGTLNHKHDDGAL
jgi:hypothetical protein